MGCRTKMALTLTPLKQIPLIQTGDSLPAIILNSIKTESITIENGDIFIIAQKIVSKSEGRMVNLTTIQPSEYALQLSKITLKDPRFVELVLRESNQVIRTRENTLIVEHKNGFICANAGIDHSNVMGSDGNPEDWYLLLPEDSDRSADLIRSSLETSSGKRIGVMIIDSHGRAWRMGTVGIAIGLSGMPGLVDLRGKTDLFGYSLKITQVGAADELAAAASLMMGQAAEGSPIIHARGFPYPLRDGNLQELIRPIDQDLFR